MCILAYVTVGVALLLFVQARNVMPQLLLVRLLFSVGAAGTSTMITALLPTMTAPCQENITASSPFLQDAPDNGALASMRAPTTSSTRAATKKPLLSPSPTRSAGLVGLFSGCGALLALSVFLRFPDLMERSGIGECPFLSDSQETPATCPRFETLVTVSCFSL